MNHRSTLGSYFGNRNGHTWPNSPLNRNPFELESKFNQDMMEMTRIMSNGTLKNISILDFPAFGSRFHQLIVYLIFCWAAFSCFLKKYYSPLNYMTCYDLNLTCDF